MRHTHTHTKNPSMQINESNRDLRVPKRVEKDLFFTSVGTTRGQGITRVVVILVLFLLSRFSDILIFWKISILNKAQILNFSA